MSKSIIKNVMPILPPSENTWIYFSIPEGVLSFVYMPKTPPTRAIPTSTIVMVKRVESDAL